MTKEYWDYIKEYYLGAVKNSINRRVTDDLNSFLTQLLPRVTIQLNQLNRLALKDFDKLRHEGRRVLGDEKWPYVRDLHIIPAMNEQAFLAFKHLENTINTTAGYRIRRINNINEIRTLIQNNPEIINLIEQFGPDVLGENWEPLYKYYIYPAKPQTQRGRRSVPAPRQQRWRPY